MPTDKQTHAQKLAAQLTDGIVSGEFPPGFHLDEQRLACRFGVSRTPVREALRQLAITGLIEIRPRRGALVATLSPEELDAMSAAMVEVEASCARLAALRMTPLERRRLLASHDTMAGLVRSGDPEAYADADQIFHLAIHAGAHNAIVANFTSALRRRLAPFRRERLRTVGRLPRSHAEHEAVVRAILTGNASAAHAAMLHHVGLVEEAYEDYPGQSGEGQQDLGFAPDSIKGVAFEIHSVGFGDEGGPTSLLHHLSRPPFTPKP